MMSWQPQDEPLRQLAQYLSDSLSFTDKNAQKNAEIVRTQIHSTLVEAKQSLHVLDAQKCESFTRFPKLFGVSVFEQSSSTYRHPISRKLSHR